MILGATGTPLLCEDSNTFTKELDHVFMSDDKMEFIYIVKELP